jgi:hypothetical protein
MASSNYDLANMLVKSIRPSPVQHLNEVYTSHNEDPVGTKTYTEPKKITRDLQHDTQIERPSIFWEFTTHQKLQKPETPSVTLQTLLCVHRKN